MKSALKALLMCVLPIVVSSSGEAQDLAKAPPNFALLGGKAVFTDFSHVDLSISFDALNGKARGRAVVNFEVAESGMPIFDMIPAIESVTLDGVNLEKSQVTTVKDPHKQSTLRVLALDVAPNKPHTMELIYDLSAGITFSQGTVSAGFFMSDLSDREYWEQYAPSNLEFDQYSQTISVEVTGTEKKHEVFANGEVEERAFNKWQVNFPSYYTTSSFYFHLVKEGRFNVSRSVYQGLKSEIPLTVYSISQSNVSTGVQRLRTYLSELENTYGPFAHRSFIAYITDAGGGMEYCGATVTSLSALGHETTHSWFARGIMPANGNAGWIDEAVASWRDNDYSRGNGPSRSPRMLGGFSPYKRFTTMDAYSYGASLISDFDGWVARSNEAGMKGVLRDMFGKFQHQTITVQMFQEHMEEALGTSLQEFFDKYIYGRTLDGSLDFKNAGWDVNWSRHPRPFTRDELKQIR